MDPESVRQWQRIFRDTLIALVGAFLLIYGATSIKDPALLGIVLGAGITCLSAPPLIRLRVDRPAEEEER